MQNDFRFLDAQNELCALATIDIRESVDYAGNVSVLEIDENDDLPFN